MKLVLILGLLLPQITKEEVIRLKKAGLSDETIMKKIDADGSVFRLSADDIIELKGAGISESLIQYMLVTAKKGTAARVGKGLVVVNRAHRSLRVFVDPQARAVLFNSGKGTEVARKGRVEFEAPAGTYTVVKNGTVSPHRITTPNVITVRGNNLLDIEVMTAYVARAEGNRDTFLIMAKEKPVAEVSFGGAAYPYDPYPSFPERRRSFRSRGFYPYSPYGSSYYGGYGYRNNVLLGAGLGAWLYDRRPYRGALIGAGLGLLVDSLRSTYSWY